MGSTQVPKSLLTLGNLRRVVALRYEGERVQPALEAIFARMVGGHNAGLMLSRVIYWQAHVIGDADTPFYRSNSEWSVELELSVATVKRSIVAVKAAGVSVEAQAHGYTKVNHYSLDVQRFLHAFADALAWTFDQVISAVRQLRELILGQREPAMVQNDHGVSPERPHGPVQNEPTPRLKMTPTSPTESYTESLSESQAESPPPSGARARESPAAGVGVSVYPASLQKLLQVTSAAPCQAVASPPPGSAAPPSPPQWALDMARHKADRGELTHGDTVAYALGIAARQAQKTPVKAGGLAMSFDEFVVER